MADAHPAGSHAADHVTQAVARQLRAQRGWTPPKVIAEHVGVSVQSVHAWEAGRRKMPLVALAKVCDYHSITVAEFCDAAGI